MEDRILELIKNKKNTKQGICMELDSKHEQKDETSKSVLKNDSIEKDISKSDSKDDSIEKDNSKNDSIEKTEKDNEIAIEKDNSLEKDNSMEKEKQSSDISDNPTNDDIKIWKYKLNIQIFPDFHSIVSQDHFAYINNKTLHLFNIPNANSQEFKLNQILKEVENVKLEVIKYNYLVLRIPAQNDHTSFTRKTESFPDLMHDFLQRPHLFDDSYDYIFFTLSNTNSLSGSQSPSYTNTSAHALPRESFRLENTRQVLLFPDYFLYVKDRVYKRKYKKLKEHVISSEYINQIFVIDELVYFRRNENIYNIFLDVNLTGIDLFNVNEDSMLLKNEKQFQIIDKSEQIPTDSMVIMSETAVLDDYITVFKEKVVNWVKIEKGKFKILGSFSVEEHVHISCCKRGSDVHFFIFQNDLNLPIQMTPFGRNCQKNDLQLLEKDKYSLSDGILEKDDISEEEECMNTKMGTEKKPVNSTDIKSDTKTDIKGDLVASLKNLGISPAKSVNKTVDNDIKSLQATITLLTSKIETLTQDINTLKSATKSTFDFLTDQSKKETQTKKKLTTSITSLTDQFTNLKLSVKDEMTVEIRNCFEKILLPAVEASFSEMKIQISTSETEETVLTLLKKNEIKGALELCLEGSDGDIMTFIGGIELTHLKSFSNNENLHLLDRVSHILTNSNTLLNDTTKKILSVIDVNEFTESEIPIFRRILKRLYDSNDQILNLLVDTQAHLFSKACMRNYGN